jgi:hypothetical protein
VDQSLSFVHFSEVSPYDSYAAVISNGGTGVKVLYILACSFALVLLAACGEVLSQQAATPTAVAPAENNQTPAEPQGTYSATAMVNNPTPKQYTQVGVLGKLLRDGQPVEGAVMNTLWNYRSTKTTCDGAKTQADGIAACTEDINSAIIGYEVVINVSFVVDGRVVARTQTSFTPAE